MITFRSAAEARDQLHQELPTLRTKQWRVKSPLDTEYQCIAWAACRTDRVWWPWDHPRFYWPPGFRKFPVYSPVPVSDFVEVFEKLFGYQKCDNANFEFGYQKVAIYENMRGATHMARQDLLGRGWLSKLGQEEDIIHLNVEDVEGDVAATAGQYGVAVQYMKRSWWTALIKLCLFRCLWATLKFRIYRVVVRWDLT
jgi:hypothetical protein